MGHPWPARKALLAQATPNVRELRWVRAAGHTVVQAWNPSGVATLLDATTAAHHAIAPQELTAAAARLVDAPVQEVQTLNAYDLHYYDRARTPWAVAPTSPARVAGGVCRPACHLGAHRPTHGHRAGPHRHPPPHQPLAVFMLHSWDWLPLLERRPLWDVVLIVLSLGGTA